MGLGERKGSVSRTLQSLRYVRLMLRFTLMAKMVNVCDSIKCLREKSCRRERASTQARCDELLAVDRAFCTRTNDCVATNGRFGWCTFQQHFDASAQVLSRFCEGSIASQKPKERLPLTNASILIIESPRIESKANSVECCCELP